MVELDIFSFPYSNGSFYAHTVARTLFSKWSQNILQFTHYSFINSLIYSQNGRKMNYNSRSTIHSLTLVYVKTDTISGLDS